MMVAVVVALFAVIFGALIWLVVLEVKLHRLINQAGSSPWTKRLRRIYGG